MLAILFGCATPPRGPLETRVWRLARNRCTVSYRHALSDVVFRTEVVEAEVAILLLLTEQRTREDAGGSDVDALKAREVTRAETAKQRETDAGASHDAIKFMAESVQDRQDSLRTEREEAAAQREDEASGIRQEGAQQAEIQVEADRAEGNAQTNASELRMGEDAATQAQSARRSEQTSESAMTGMSAETRRAGMTTRDNLSTLTQEAYTGVHRTQGLRAEQDHREIWPELRVQKTARPDKVLAGEVFAFEVVLKNIGPIALRDLVLKEQHPEHAVFLTASAAAPVSDGASPPGAFRVTGTLAPGEQRTLIFRYRAQRPANEPSEN
jgi:hypothetical protein